MNIVLLYVIFEMDIVHSMKPLLFYFSRENKKKYRSAKKKMNMTFLFMLMKQPNVTVLRHTGYFFQATSKISFKEAATDSDIFRFLTF